MDQTGGIPLLGLEVGQSISLGKGARIEALTLDDQGELIG